MSNKKKQVSVEDIVKDVCDILDNIIYLILISN